MEKTSKIYVAGHLGLVGSALIRQLKQQNYTNLVMRTRQELDLFDGKAVAQFLKQEQPEYIFLAAAKAGGIYANSAYAAEFIYENLQIQNNVIHHSHQYGVKKLLFLGSSCIYPKHCPQPIKEEYLLTGPLEPTNDAYSVAKIAGIKTCQSYNLQYGTNFISVMPTNLYGINDNFHPENSHVLPALLSRFHEAKQNGASKITVWGTGTPKRELLFVDDLAEACIFLMEHYNDSQIINVGTGKDLNIRELVNLIKEVVGCDARIVFDTTKPDGTPQKVLDVSRINQLGWFSKTSLKEGLETVYHWYQHEYLKNAIAR
ncbi:MAG: GDP-L-fucose synthase [SAR324 cluster bacterium]|nr:GDP-L-fucose synthase [SAR324 cluster bacterium]